MLQHKADLQSLRKLLAIKEISAKTFAKRELKEQRLYMARIVFAEVSGKVSKQMENYSLQQSKKKQQTTRNGENMNSKVIML